MPRQLAVSVDNNFTKGLITEASGLNFPENACTDEDNCVFKLTGAVERRLGMDLEFNYSSKTISRANSVIVPYLWKNPNGLAEVNLLVVQIGDHLYFWDTGSSSVSGGAINDNIDLTDYIPSGSTFVPTLNECHFASGNGKLFVTHPYLDSFYVEYDAATNTFTDTQINITIRDHEGLEDGYETDERPTSSIPALSEEHYYNLLNQGWSTTNLATWDTAFTDVPSNADVMWTFKSSSDAFDTATVPNVMNGNSPAPKGHFKLNLYNQDRSTASTIGGITIVTTENHRCSTVAFFAGRVFYSGLNYSGFTSKIYFSQIVERDSQYGECYQTNDPTSETAFDLLPSDGGVISIPDAGTIIKLFAVQTGVAVFATNGVWFITGSTGLGFTANDYTVMRLSSIPALSSASFVDLAGSPCWWNLDGIYVLSEGGSSGGSGLSVKSLTDRSIKTFYQDLPSTAKKTARGSYNKLTGVIQWVYRDIEVSDINDQYNFNKILNFDTNLEAFYRWSFDANHDVKLNGLVVLESASGLAETVNVVIDNADDVVTDGGDNVVIFSLGNQISKPEFKYIVSFLDGSNNEFSIAEVKDTTHTDWVRYGDPIGYTSFFMSGYKIRGEAIKDAQVNYVGFYSNNESRYQVQGVWDYANTNNSARWSYPQIIDTTGNPNFDVVYRRRKIRGRGKALQFRVQSMDNNPFHIVGWSNLTSSTDMP